MAPPRTKYPDPAVAALARAFMLELIVSGRTQVAAMRDMKLAWRNVASWRRDDPAWAGDLDRINAERSASRYYTSEDIVVAKEAILHSIAEEGRTLTEATADIGVGKRAVAKWRRDDLLFEDGIKDALRILADRKADAALETHLEVPDARAARVASDNLWKWVAAHNARYRDRPRAEPDESVAKELTSILRAAVSRLIEMSAPPAAMPLIEAEAEPVRQLRFNSGPPEEGT
jgi:hypothetical protein